MMQRRSKVFEKYTLLSNLQQQFRSWRAWTGILAVAAVVSFFVTQDWKWRLGLSVSALGFAYQAFVCYNKWKNVLQEVERSKLVTASQEFGKDKASSIEAVMQNASLSSKSNPDSSISSSSSFANNNNISSNSMSSSSQRTPSESSSLRRRNMLRTNADVMHSPDHNPENFSPALARKYAQQVMQSPDPLSPMMMATSSSKSVSLNDNRFSAFPTTPSMMDSGYQERRQYHVSPLVTDTVKRSVNSAEPRRSNALQALGITSIPDEWIEKLKGNLGAHLYAILKLHDQSVQVIKAFLKQEEEKGAIPKGSVAKVTPLLDHEVTYKKVQLDNGSFLTIDGILEYCGRPIAPAAPAPTMTTTFALSMAALKPAQPPQPGVPEDILQKYKAASSFFDLCRRIQEVITQRRFPEDEGSSAANTNALAMLGIFGGALSPQATSGSTSSSSSSNRRTSLMERLRQLQSSDRKLRIEWQSMVRGGGGGGFGFGGRSNTRDFIAGHQDMEMMDQDIVVALFLHRCNDHQTRIISASTSPPQTFSDMHVVAHAEDMTQVLQRRHKELSATFDQQVSRGGGGGSSATSGSGRFGGTASSSSASASASASREASALLNMLLRNYPQPVEEDATGTTGAMGSGGLPTASSSSASSAASAGRSVSPHYDLLRMATQVQQASQMSQASWQQMSSMLAAQLSGNGGGNGSGNGGGSAPMFLSFFPQYKEIWTVDSGRNDIFEVILILLVLMTLTAPPNDLEEDTTARSNSLGDDDDVLSQVSSSSSHHHHGHHHHHHNHALAHIVSQLEGTHQRKQLLSAHEDRAAVMATLRRVFKLKGMGTGVAADARVVRGLFDEVIDVHELRHLMYEYHNVQLLQQQSQQQVQQQQQLYAAAVAAAGGGGGVGGAASSSSSSSSLVLSGMGATAATGMFFGNSSSRGGLSGGGVGGAVDARSPFSPTMTAAVGSHSRSTQSLNLLLGSGSAGVHEPLSTSMMMDHSPFGGHVGSGSIGGGYESTTATAAASTPFRHMSGSAGIGGAGGGVGGGGYTPLSPLYSPPLFGRGGSVGTTGAVGSGAMGPPPAAASLSTGFSPLGAAMTPITPGGGGGMGGGGGSALRGFNASFSTEMSFGGPGTAEKRYTPFALR